MQKHILYQISDPQGGMVYIGSYTVPSEYKYMVYGSDIKKAMRKYFMDTACEVNIYLYATEDEMKVKYNELVSYYFDIDNMQYKLYVENGDDDRINIDYMGIRDDNGYMFITDVSGLNYITGDLVCFDGGRVVVRSGGSVAYCDPGDYYAYSGVSVTNGMALVRDRSGVYSFIDVDDERIGSGEVGVFWCGRRKTAQMRSKTADALKGSGVGTEHSHYGKRWVYKGSVSKLVHRDVVNVIRSEGWFPGRKPKETIS